ncbi:hypothetical protein [Nocardia tengchongensis]|uniref:hypothetical protein n=1 Tax=Nocardia tengchongensis TaxID=2055889 RepID=UPI003613206F
MVRRSASAVMIGIAAFGAVTLVPVTARAGPLPGEEGVPCPWTRVIKVDPGWEDYYQICGGDPTVNPARRTSVIANISEGVLRISPAVGSPALQAFSPAITGPDGITGLTAHLVSTAPDLDGSVLVAPHGYVHVTGGASVKIAVDYSSSSMTVLADALVKTGMKRIGMGFVNRFSQVQGCARGTAGIFDQLGDRSRPASFLDAAPELVDASECLPLWNAIEREVGSTGLKAFESSALREVAEDSWRPMTKLIIKYLEEIAIKVR